MIAQICYLSYFYLKCNKFNYCSKVLSLPQENKKYTYADYLAWPEEERFELIDGIPYMQAAPSWQHQSISTELITQFSNYLKNKPYRVFHAPFDLRLPDECDKNCFWQNRNQAEWNLKIPASIYLSSSSPLL